MKCSSCGTPCVKVQVSTAFERPNAAVVWECSNCKRIQMPPEYRRITDKVWEQLRERSKGLPRYHDDEVVPPHPKSSYKASEACRLGHLRSEHGRLYTRPSDGQTWWICTTCTRERKRTPENLIRRKVWNRNYEIRRSILLT